MSLYHQRPLILHLDSSGSAAGTVAGPPQRYAGVYYTINSGSAPAIGIENLGRQIFAKNPAASADGAQVLLHDDEVLVSGELLVTVGNGDAFGTVTAALFLTQGG